MLKSLLLASLLAVAPAAHAETDPAAREVEQYFRAGIEAFNRGDLERFLQQFHPELRMYAVNEWLRGEAQIRERFTTTFRDFPRVRMEISRLRARSGTPDVVTVEFEWATFPRGDDAAWRGVGSGVYVRTAQGWREVLEHETVVSRDPRLVRPAPTPG